MTSKDLENIVAKAQAAYQKENYRKAAECFQAAVAGYQAQNNPLMAAEMANNLSVTLLKTGKAQPALEALEGTEDIFIQAKDRIKQSMAIGNRAAALEALNRIEEAEVAYQQSAELLKEYGEIELYTYVMQSLSALQLRQGKQIDGIISMSAGLVGVENPSLRQRILKKLLKLPFKFFGR